MEDFETFPKLTETSVAYISNYAYKHDDVDIVFLPGFGYNHADHAEGDNMSFKREGTVYVAEAKRYIRKDEELRVNYNGFGTPGKALQEFAKKFECDLVFPGYNAFVKPYDA